MRSLNALLVLLTVATACYVQPDPLPAPTIHTPLFEQHRDLIASGLPASFDWRDVSGVVSPIRSQYLPTWCGSCWAHAVTSSLSDRVNILRGQPGYEGGRGAVMLSVQNYLDCGKTAGTCNGGSWERAFEWAASRGVCDDSCSPYKGVDGACGAHEEAMCTLIFENRTAVPVPGARRFKVADWGYLNASSHASTKSDPAKLMEMQAEIMARGPIVCSMETNDDHNPLGAWHCYEGGVYKTTSTFKSTNHVISLLGWGEDVDGTPFWVGRHSGGTIFGEEGFFRIERGVNALNIESHCGYATVLDPDPPRANASTLPCENGVPR